jgi:hypothetical protein
MSARALRGQHVGSIIHIGARRANFVIGGAGRIATFLELVRATAGRPSWLRRESGHRLDELLLADGLGEDRELLEFRWQSGAP